MLVSKIEKSWMGEKKLQMLYSQTLRIGIFVLYEQGQNEKLKENKCPIA